MSSPKLIIGLGNPGFRYKKTRHNVGFLAVDYIQKNIGGFSKWKNNKKLKSEISENSERGIILAKPQTYMNSSGEAVKSIIGSWNLEFGSCTIVHDDFDLPLGEFKLEKDRGSAGHKGVQSIIEALGSNEFWRLRIGIRPIYLETEFPSALGNSVSKFLVKKGKAENFVLKKFTREEKKTINEIIPVAVNELLGGFNN